MSDPNNLEGPRSEPTKQHPWPADQSVEVKRCDMHPCAKCDNLEGDPPTPEERAAMARW